MEAINGYQIFAELKDGPVNTIYKALDLRHHQIVLIKLLHAEAEAEHWREQYVQESKISMQLSHANLRRTLQAGVHETQPYLILEYIEGPTLAELIQRGKKLPLDLCLFIAKEIARAVAAVHAHKVLHNDIKPQNIFLSFNGAVKLGDLGLAREFTEANPLLAGTPAYMSPEYILGRDTREASDLFSFGAVLYEMLTGEVAFVNRTLAATLLHVANWDPVPIARLRPETPPQLINICRKLLAKNPAERYHYAEDVIIDFTQLERQYGLQTTSQNLATYLEDPSKYVETELQAVTVVEPVERTRVPSRFASTYNWGLLAMLSAVMFFAGVLFIKLLKDHMENGAPARRIMPYDGAPLFSFDTGYLDLHATPGSTIYINRDSVGIAPLPHLLALPAGEYEVMIKSLNAHAEAQKIRVSKGDTARYDFTRTIP